MQGLLFRGVVHRDGFRFAGGEVADVAPPGAIDEGREGVQRFQRADEGKAVFRVAGLAIKQVAGVLQTVVGIEDMAAPGGGDRLADGGASRVHPAFPGAARSFDGSVDVGVGFRHLVELAPAGQHVGP